MTKWIDIKKQKPKHNQNCLITDGNIVAAGCADMKSFSSVILWEGCGFCGWEWNWNFEPKQITHWMGLPEPPKK